MAPDPPAVSSSELPEVCKVEVESKGEVVDAPCTTGPWAQGPLVPPCNGPLICVLQFVPGGKPQVHGPHGP